jgi:hypothetical protein
MLVCRQVAGAGLLVAVLAVFASSAQASVGYEPDPVTPTIAVQGEEPQQVAIDQGNQRIYVAIVTNNFAKLEFGQIDQLESAGTATAASPFRVSGESFFSGVAVNPLSGGIYAAEDAASTPFGVFGKSQIDQFSSTGTLGTQFGTNNGPGVIPKIATDSNGKLYYPSATSNAVQVFNSAGSLQETISCSGCPGGGFNNPSGVALDSNNDLYVVDLGNDRVVKFTHSGGPYTYASTLQSGRKAAAVAVDPSNNSIFVGDEPGGGEYHIVAYNSAGTQFDDFGAGLFVGTTFGAYAAGQIAVNATTHRLYVSDPKANLLRVFSQATIDPPTATTKPASSVGQVAATMNATVNANFHATIDCHFEYTDDADFLANGYANATDVPCASMPNGSENTEISASATSLLPETTYHFRIAAANNGGEAIGGSKTFTTLASAPSTVTTGAPSGITQTVAVLTGKVNPHGGTVTNCHFEYGEGISFAKGAACTTAVDRATTDVAESVKVTGLTAKTAYHYRLSVTSNAGTVVGNVEDFTTLPQPPTVTTEVASAIAQTSATVAGLVNPNGGASSCHFEYGTSTSYGSVGECATDPGSGEAAVAEQFGIAGLTPGTTYHYRLVGTNAGGTTKGSDLSFTTQPLPPSPASPGGPQPQPPSGGPVATPKPLKCKKNFQKKKVRGKFKCVKKKHRRH